MGTVMAVTWDLIAMALGWRASFRLEGAHPRLVIHHKRHRHRFAGADAWKRAVSVSIRTRARFHQFHKEISMSTYLVAVHILVDTDGANLRSDVVAALEAQLDRPAVAVAAAGTVVDWAVAGEDLASSMAPAVIPSDYMPGTTPFPQWPAAQPKRSAP